MGDVSTYSKWKFPLYFHLNLTELFCGRLVKKVEIKRKKFPFLGGKIGHFLVYLQKTFGGKNVRTRKKMCRKIMSQNTPTPDFGRAQNPTCAPWEVTDSAQELLSASQRVRSTEAERRWRRLQERVGTASAFRTRPGTALGRWEDAPNWRKLKKCRQKNHSKTRTKKMTQKMTKKFMEKMSWKKRHTIKNSVEKMTPKCPRIA